MKLEQHIVHAIRKYPSLYKDIDYKHSREKLLDHLFFTNGNGLEWVNGELVGNEEHEIAEIEELPEDYFTTPIMSTEDDESEFSREWRKDKPYKPHELHSIYALNIYPICKFARILRLPDDIKPDWLEGAKEAVNIATDYYADPYKHGRHIYISEWIMVRNFESIKNFLEVQKEFLAVASDRIATIQLQREWNAG